MRTASDAAVTSTFDTTGAVECSFDSEGTAHLMNILSNMYRDAPMAALREYAANARDSHVQAGNSAPIEITLPSEWEPKLTIRDQGLGLSENEIIAVYARYGKSTKRDNDDEVGAFGIGAKSAFTISTQFTVTGIKDGAKTTALFALNADGVGTVDIKARTTTSESNGVTVTIPVDDPDAMRQAADTLFTTWEPGTVLIDGREPEYLPESMLHICEGLYAHRSTYGHPNQRTGVTVVMGGIPYPASAPMLRMAARRTDNPTSTLERVFEQLAQERSPLHLLAIVPVGTVDITPSREDLRDTPRTVAALARLVGDYVTHVEAACEREVAQEPTPMHASMRLRSLAGFLPPLQKRGFTWQGQHLAGCVTVPHPVIRLVSSGRSHKAESDSSYEAHLGQSFDNVVAITGVDLTADKKIRRRARRYMTHKNVGALLLLPDEQGQIGWFSYGGSSPLATVTASAFLDAASALPPVSSSRTGGDVRYEVWTQAGGPSTWPCSRVTDAADSGHRVLLASQHYTSAHRQFLTGALQPSDVLVQLSGQQTQAAFYRRFPGAASVDPILTDHARRVLDSASERERLALEFRRDRGIDEIAGIPALQKLSPIQTILDNYRERERAFRASDRARIELLQQARSQLGGTHETAPDALTEFPILRLLLRELPAPWLRAHLTTDLCDDLALYTSAAQARNAGQQAA